jgi:hypothetical protein
MIASVFKGKDLFDEINLEKESISMDFISLAAVY